MQEQEIVYDPEYVYFQIERTYTNYVNRILEGYEYVGGHDNGECGGIVYGSYYRINT